METLQNLTISLNIISFRLSCALIRGSRRFAVMCSLLRVLSPRGNAVLNYKVAPRGYDILIQAPRTFMDNDSFCNQDPL